MISNGGVTEVKALLARLRDIPANTSDASDEVLVQIYKYLIGVGSDSKDGRVHWFCSRADQLTVDASTFLLRLFAYNSPHVDSWKARMKSCLAGCAECVQGLGEVKFSSRLTYFGAFSDGIMNEFLSTFDTWELSLIKDALDRVGIKGIEQTKMSTLRNIPSAVLYHMVSNLRILCDPTIMGLVRSRPSSSSWPRNYPPPGLLVLLFDELQEVRQWAQCFVSSCTEVPMAESHFITGHELALKVIFRLLTRTEGVSQVSNIPIPTAPVVEGATQLLQSIAFTSDPHELWSGYYQVLRLVPNSTAIMSAVGIDCRKVVIGNLHGVGPQFVDVLRCLLFLLKRFGAQLWTGEGPEYPRVVFDAIKDNQSFTKLIEGIKISDGIPWVLGWFEEYLISLKESAIFGDVLAKVVDLLCEELQHARFIEVRPTAMSIVIRLLLSLMRKAQTEGLSRRHSIISSVLDIHVDVFIAVAFSRQYSDEQWKSARDAARELIIASLTRDVQGIVSSALGSCKFLAGQIDNFPVCTVRDQLWRKTYGSLQTSDVEGAASILGLVAEFSHLDVLNKLAYKSVLSKSDVQAAFDTINHSLSIVRDGFVDAISKFANYNQQGFLRDFFQRSGVAKNVITLMFSPIDDMQTAAKTLIGQAFDIDGRLDCFRALLSNLPEPSLSGMLGFLERFVQYAPVVTEACSLSKSLVQCLTDVIDVLCSGADALLLSSKFRDSHGPAARLPHLWTLMTRCITVIFKRTPLWANYFDIPEMVVWMRDALIFARDMLAQWRVMESAVIMSNGEPASRAGKPSGLSKIGKNMMNDLQPVLTELSRWLRLSDEELLHQSFALVQKVLECFRATNVPPSKVALMKLNKHIEDARKQTGGALKTRLDAGRVSKLEAALAAFGDEDDDVVFVSMASRPPATDLPESKSVKQEVQTSKPKVTEPKAPQKLEPYDRKTAVREAPTFPTFRRTGPTVKPDPDRRPVVPNNKAKNIQSEASSSSDSDSDGGAGRGLAALGKFQKSPKVPKPTERRQIKMLDVTNQAKNATMERMSRRDDARRRALRLRPNISGLHRALLSWDYDHTGSEPPVRQKLFHVPDKFVDHRHYLSVFEPLLLMECWAQIVQSKDESQPIHECKLISKQFTDDFIDLEATISGALQKDWYLNETDVVLLTRPDGKKSYLAKTQSYKRGMMDVQMTLRCFMPANTGDQGLQINTIWNLKKVISLSTLHREYAALMGLPYYDSFSTVMQPRLSAFPHLDRREVEETMNNYRVNEPQARAILSSLRTEGFVLIQGPPGTGKTSTICGLVEAFLQKRLSPATSIHVGRTANQGDKGPVQKILLCAPSNAAIDEVASRLKEGFRGVEKRGSPIKVVRIGNEKSFDVSVMDISLDFLCEQRMNGDGHDTTSPATGDGIAALRQEIDAVKRAKQEKVKELTTIQNNAARVAVLEDEIKRLNTRRMALTQQFDRLKDKRKSDIRTLDAARRKVRMEILQEADVICATLAGSGHDSIEQLEFEMIIIDEAAQAVELSSLIPLKFRSQRCIMVGDPQQLPPTVLSQEACKFHYNQSLFVRLQKHRPDAVHLLSIQYRMHPDISQLPSHIFYQKRLLDGPDMASKTSKPWHSHTKFGTYRFFNVHGGQEQGTPGHSLKNATEAQIAVALYARLRKEYSAADLDYHVGIVSMYRGQVNELQRSFARRFGEDIRGKIHFNTVDGFQGQEKDIIILSCVRAGPGLQSVGFLSDVRRMNVALTRAKSSLFVLGHTPTLERSNHDWREIINNAQSRGVIADVDVSFFTEPNVARVIPPPRVQTSKSAKAPSAPKVPDNMALVTPQTLAETVHAKPQSHQRPPAMDLPKGAQPQKPKPKRPPSPAAAGPSNPKQLPKRPKKEQASIFIPKKKS